MESDSETITKVEGSSKTITTKTAADTNQNESVWLTSYMIRLSAAGLSQTARSVISHDSEYIVRKGVLGAGSPRDADSSWSNTRLRRGLAVGSVQSGKTASMLAVAARSLDEGVDVVVLLTGTRTALWRQTLQRSYGQLDGWSEQADGQRRTHRVMIPRPNTMLNPNDRPRLKDLYFETPNIVTRRLSQKKPVIALVMKHSDHLMCFGRWLRNTLAASFERIERPIHVLVIDDEADDGSILDAVVEHELEPDSDRLKLIPRHVAQIWSGPGPNYTTFHDKLHVTYLAYTATPQANVLQNDHNPLAPTDFVVALRTPLDHGPVETPREPTYHEPAGLSAYYIGGEMFYERLAQNAGAITVGNPFPDADDYEDAIAHQRAIASEHSDMLSDSLRAYFVAVASHLLVSGKRISEARSLPPSTAEIISNACPSPLCKLIHSSSAQEDQFEMARMVSAWSACLDPFNYDLSELPLDTQGRPNLSAEGLCQRLDQEEESWITWLDKYEATRTRLSTLPGGDTPIAIGRDRWPEIRELLRGEVFSDVRLSVINSDPNADDRPLFDPVPNAGLYTCPKDVFTIFVSGNVMSRGVTIEGLVTTLFLRSSNNPAADTQMQMQRWFGYRGRHLRWCRLFLFEDQLRLFRDYHQADEMLRREILGEMNTNPGRAPSPMVLQSADYRATSKIANIRNLPLCPGADPFVKAIEHGDFASGNAAILGELLSKEKWQNVVVRETTRGLAMQERQLSLLEVASLLERFRYSHHDPDLKLPQNDRWRAIQRSVGLDDRLFRTPGHLAEAKDLVRPQNCPYSIAAYLRLWNALLTRRARWFYPTDDTQTPWSLIDLAQYEMDAPKFYVGIRFGEAGLSSDQQLALHGVQRMSRQTRNGVAVSTWGTRNPGGGVDSYLGDQYFDYHVHNREPFPHTEGEPLWRPRGEPGQILFHVLRDEHGAADAVTVGLAIPRGGPDHFAALRPGGAV